jgi:hypothetical protein
MRKPEELLLWLEATKTTGWTRTIFRLAMNQRHVPRAAVVLKLLCAFIRGYAAVFYSQALAVRSVLVRAL